MTFPETVGRMMEAGVERDDADLTRLVMTQNGEDGAIHTELMPLADAPTVPPDSSVEQVEGAIKAIQQGPVDYSEFLRLLMAAGTASYGVSLSGRKAIDFGRSGGLHVEPFLAAKPSLGSKGPIRPGLSRAICRGTYGPLPSR